MLVMLGLNLGLNYVLDVFDKGSLPRGEVKMKEWNETS